MIIKAKLTDIQGNLIANISGMHTFSNPYYGVNVYFDKPYRIIAGQRYIAATQVQEPPSYNPPYITFEDFVTSIQCGPTGNKVTVTFSNVPQAEMDDSNGSTVGKGQVPDLLFKPL